MSKNFFISLLTGIVLLLGTTEHGYPQRALSIGGKKWGIALGNPESYSGIRLNLLDLNRGKILNGINFCLISNKTPVTNGFSLSVLNYKSCVNGIQLGLFNLLENSDWSNGIKVGIINFAGGQRGILIGAINSCSNLNGFMTGIYNVAAGGTGLSVGFYNRCINGVGLQIGVINTTNSNRRAPLKRPSPGCFTGMQFGFINTCGASKKILVQTGIINWCYRSTGGLQFGLSNISHSKNVMVQFGLINFQKNNKWYAKILPFVNISTKKNKKHPADQV